MKPIFSRITVFCFALPAFFSAFAQETPPPFPKLWFDGNAELSSYTLSVNRYGEDRLGSAVAIFVTEPFSISKRVKSDPGKNPKSDEIGVLKLNLVKDFPTGIYDYNAMTSVFIGAETSAANNKWKIGNPLKISFSAQEWCGHVYQQFLPQTDSVQSQTHSYFDGEADESLKMPLPKNGVFSDSLFHWARGLAAPYMTAGQKLTLPLLPSAFDIRMGHFKPVFSDASFEVSGPNQFETISDASGKRWQTEKRTVVSSDGRRSEFWVENVSPQKIIKWSFKGGKGIAESGLMLKSTRLEYWKLNGSKGIEQLKELGMIPRNPLSP